MISKMLKLSKLLNCSNKSFSKFPQGTILGTTSWIHCANNVYKYVMFYMHYKYIYCVRLKKIVCFHVILSKRL